MPSSGDERQVGSETRGSLGLRECLERGLAADEPAVQRLSYAHTSVSFKVTDGEESVTLLLDRTPPELAETDEPAEIEIELDRAQVEQFACGRLLMPAAVITGQVAAQGPIRKYLEVDPILRGLLARLEGEGAHSNGDLGHERPKADRALEMDEELLAIETRDLHKSFGSDEVLTGVDLAVPEGVISVVLGPSGTGKSVLLQHIIGLLKPDSGDVLIRGRPLSGMSRSEVLSLRREIGVMFQDGALFSAMNVYENVAFPLRQHTNLSDKEIREVVTDHLRSVGLEAAAQQMPGELSGGMRKRAGLARSLVLEPGILLCDEPDSGLDPVRTALLGDLLIEQHAEMGGTVLVITHDVALARLIGDHISVLYQGGIVEAGMTEALLDSDDEFVIQFLAGDAEGPLGMDAG